MYAAEYSTVNQARHSSSFGAMLAFDEAKRQLVTPDIIKQAPVSVCNGLSTLSPSQWLVSMEKTNARALQVGTASERSVRERTK